jgi:hypothetical protein
MSKVILVLVLLLLTSCGVAGRVGATLTGYFSTCIDGVSYLQFTSGVTVQYNKDGTVKKC